MLQEQKAVVVGGTSGIGLAAAIELCRARTQVWVTGRTPDKAMGAAAAIGDRVTGHAEQCPPAQGISQRLCAGRHAQSAWWGAARIIETPG